MKGSVSQTEVALARALSNLTDSEWDGLPQDVKIWANSIVRGVKVKEALGQKTQPAQPSTPPSPHAQISHSSGRSSGRRIRYLPTIIDYLKWYESLMDAHSEWCNETNHPREARQP